MAATGSGTNSNSNLLDLDILLRLPNANQFASQVSDQMSRMIAGSTDAAIHRLRDQMISQQAFVARAEKTILQSQITAMKRGLGTKEIESVRDEFEKINEERQKAFLKAAELTDKIAREQDADVRKRLEMEKEALEAFAKMRDAEGKKQIALLRRMEIEQSRAIKGGTIAESMTKALEDGFNDISGGNLSQFSAKLTKTLGSAFTAASAKASQMADDRAAAGDASGAEALEGLAKGLAGLAKFAIVATAVVGAFAAIFAMAAMLDAKMKDMNIAILQQVSAFDLLGESGGNLADALENIRNVTTSFGLAMRTGATAEQLNGMVNAIAKFGDGVTDFNSSQQLTRDLEEIASYARIVGEDFESMADSFASYADRMGSSLDDVTDSFFSVVSAARDSGFGVNRFQAAVFEATANTALYNKRLDETAGLLNLLSKSVGLEDATQMMQETGDYYQNRGLQERFVDINTTNRGAVTEIFENELASMISGMAPDLSQNLNRSLRQGLGGLGIDAGGMNTEQLMRALQGVSSEQRNLILGGMSREERNVSNNMLDVIGALEGGDVERARGLSSLGSAGAFAMRYHQGRQLIGNTRFNDMSMAQELYMEQQTGMSPQEIRRMRRVEQSFEAEMAGLQNVAAGGGTLQQLHDFQQAGYQFEGGRIFFGEGENRREIESITDYMMSTGGRLEEMMEEDEMVSMTRQIVENTMKFEDIIANGVTSFLAKIFPLVQWISDGIFALVRVATGSSGAEYTRADEADRDSARARLESEIEAANTRIEELQTAPLISEDGFSMDFAALAQRTTERNAEIERLREEVGTKTSALDELNQVVSESEMQEFYGRYLPETMMTGVQFDERTVSTEDLDDFTWFGNNERDLLGNASRAAIEQELDAGTGLYAPSGLHATSQAFAELFTGPTAAAGPIAEETAESSEITAEETAEQTRLQEESVAIEEDQGEKLQDLLDAMFESTALTALGGENLVGGEARRIYSGIRGGQTAAQLGISQADYDRFSRAILGAPANDFIFQDIGGQARITPIHSQDQFIGMKPGGPIDAAMGNKGGGGNGNVTIYVNGGNTSEIMRVMNQVLDRKGIYPSRPHRGK